MCGGDRRGADGRDGDATVKRTWRALVLVALVCVGLCAAAWIVIDLDAAGRVADDVAALAPAEAGLVLGTSPRLPGRWPNPYFDNRIATAAHLWAAGKVEYLIVSGNHSGPYDEPSDMREALIAAGVPAERIYRDGAGFRTLDSIVRAKQVFGLQRAIVVSQRFHVARALFIADWHGLDFQGLAAPDAEWRLGDWTPVREVGARLRALADAALGLGLNPRDTRVTLGVDPPK